MKNMIGLKDDVSAQMKDPNHKKQRYYGYVEDYGYGITGWLQVVVEDGKIVKCFYDEIFADHTKDIVYDDLKQFYRQSKYYSTTYEDPFPSGWDLTRLWLVASRISRMPSTRRSARPRTCSTSRACRAWKDRTWVSFGTSRIRMTLH